MCEEQGRASPSVRCRPARLDCSAISPPFGKNESLIVPSVPGKHEMDDDQGRQARAARVASRRLRIEDDEDDADRQQHQDRRARLRGRSPEQDQDRPPATSAAAANARAR